MALIERLPDNAISVGRKSQERIALKNLANHPEFEQILATTNLFHRNIHNQLAQYDNSSLQEVVSSDFSYAERVQSVERKSDVHKTRARERIAQLRQEIKAIRTSKFKILLRSSKKEIEGLFKDLGDGGELARFLLLEGYLDDSYYQYTSLFHSGRLSPNDNKFLIQIRAFQTPGPHFPIDNPNEVIVGMREDDFGLDYALNVRLVDALLESEEHNDRLDKVFAYLSNEFSNQQEFFKAYYESGSHVGLFLRQLVDSWRGLGCERPNRRANRATGGPGHRSMTRKRQASTWRRAASGTTSPSGKAAVRSSWCNV